MKYFKYLLMFFIIIPLKVNASIGINCPEVVNPGKPINCQINSSLTITNFTSNLFIDAKVIYDGTKPLSNFVHPTLGTAVTYSKNLTYSSASGGKSVAEISIFVPLTFNPNDYFALVLNKISYKILGQDESTTQTNLSKFVKVTAVPTTTTTTTRPIGSTEKTFVITLNPNNDTNNIVSESCTTTGKSCKINLTNVSAPTKKDFIFNGWGTENNCTQGNKTSYDATTDVTLYACWISNALNTTTTTNVPTDTTLFLNTLTITGQDFVFSRHIYEYALTVLYEITNLEITATPAKEGVVVTINEEIAQNLIVGENDIVVSLADSKGNTNAYTIKVTRLKEGEVIKVPNNDANLKKIILDPYKINFSPQTISYDLAINYGEKTLQIYAEANDPAANVEIIGNENLVTGSIVKIKVTAEDGTILTYELRITVKSIFETYRLYFIGGIGILLIILMIIISRRRAKKSKSKKASIGKVAPNPGASLKPLPQSATPKAAPTPSTPITDVKNQVEVLDI